jgi:hypothetical protein
MAGTSLPGTVNLPCRARGHATEADLVQQKPLTVGLEARVVEVRRVREAGGRHVVVVALADERLDHVERAAEEMRPAGDGGGSDGLEERAFRDVYVDEVVEAVVDYGAWGGGRDEVVLLSVRDSQ